MSTKSNGRSPAKHREVEQKFAFDGAPALSLGAVKGVESVRDDRAYEMDATYFDTEDLRLARRHVTLRRREGGDDAGWHIKVPVDDDHDRIELRLPLEAGGHEVPDEFTRDLIGLTHGRPLEPVADLHSHREEHHLIDRDHTDLAVVSIDDVDATSHRAGTARSSAWRELEVELIDGSTKVIDRVADHLYAVGAQPAPWWSKVGRALDGEIAEPAPATGPATAGEVALTYLGQHLAELERRDIGVRAEQPDAVHKMRVATRRLRATLATFRPFLDAEAWEPVRDELAWIGDRLGRVRDLEVLRDRLLDDVDQLEPELTLGPVRDRIRRTLQGQQLAATGQLNDALQSDRYLSLLQRLATLLADPPLTAQADHGPHRATRRMEHAVKRVDRAAERADQATEPADRDRQLHEVRKAAKRARYAAEALEPVVGRRARRVAHRMERIQDVLGEQHDAVTARPVLRELGVGAHLAGQNGFTFGLLSGLEHEAAERARAAYVDELS